nr:FtsX-like permease family protein [Phytoactinopolyspora halophila]
MSAMFVLGREAVASARGQVVTSVLTVAMVAGMCVAVLMTTGRTAAAEDAALAEIDAAGTRSIVVRADADARLTANVIDRLQAVTEIDTAIGFGPIVDARNAQVPDGPKVPLRNGYGTLDGRSLVVPDLPDRALASTEAIQTLGFRDGLGALRTDTGHELVVSGKLEVPAYATFLEPLVVIPSSKPDAPSGTRPTDPLTVLIVLADSPRHVAPVSDTVKSLLEAADETKITMETSQELATIRTAIQGELGSYGRGTVLVILAVSAALVAVNLLTLVSIRRKDFGRRRALGATRSLIVALLLTQTALLAGIGALVGVAGALTALSVTGSPLPGPSFVIAVVIAAVLTALLGALLPAISAARKDPLHELRVP